MNGRFYVISAKDKTDNIVGFVIAKKGRIEITTGAKNADVTQFPTYEKAEHFIRQIKNQVHNVKFFIHSNEELMAAGVLGSRMEQDCFYPEDEFGRKCFYDSVGDGYLFKEGDVGYCIWKTAEEVEAFLEHYKFKEVYNCNFYVRTLSKTNGK